jgi:hypothetical protein
MTVIYFTDAALIDDVFIRRSLLRIPEVIEKLRASAEEFIKCDLFLAMNEDVVYRSLNYHQRSYLKTLIQEALFKRWAKKGIEPDLILRRKDYFYFTELTQVFQKLSTIDTLSVVTIGPGFDELETFLRLRLKLNSTPLNEFISQDPHLGWFWNDVRSSLELHS